MMRTALKLGMSVSEYWECTARDVYNFIRARMEWIQEEREERWDNVRHIMWAPLVAMSGKPDSPLKVLRLPRDKNIKEISPYDLQELKRWNELMDKEMRNE